MSFCVAEDGEQLVIENEELNSLPLKTKARPWFGSDLWLPSIFGDNMVLQRGLPVPIYGRAPAGTDVVVRFADQEERAVSDSHCRWLVRLRPLNSMKMAAVLTVWTADGRNTLCYTNVVVGDVWICAGQSNMEFMLKNAVGGSAVIEEASAFPLMRCFRVARGMAEFEQEDVDGLWQVSSPEAVKTFSAVGYFFGKRLHHESDVPIGLIGSYWGGTRIEPWIPRSGIRAAPELKSANSRLDIWEAAAAAATPSAAVMTVIETASGFDFEVVPTLGEGEMERPLDGHLDMIGRKGDAKAQLGPATYQDETALYNGMIAGLVPYGIRGVIWYQGESNAPDGLKYWPKLRALINSWRQLWAQDSYPVFFYVVQLTNFSSTPGASLVREAQRRVIALPFSGLAVTMDIGDVGDLHPNNKKDVGDRLALWALRDILGQDLVVSGPLANVAYLSAEGEAGSVSVTFDHTGGGLMVGKKEKHGPVQEICGDSLPMCEIAGEDRIFKKAKGKLLENGIIISSPEMVAPRFVRYACGANRDRKMLYNRAGLPASPFQMAVTSRTDAKAAPQYLSQRSQNPP